MDVRQPISTFLATLQHQLFPALEAVLEAPLTPVHRRIIRILELVRVEQVIPPSQPAPWGGRPPRDRRKLARAYLVKAALNLGETTDLLHLLTVDRTLRRLCGWEEGESLPSLATFSRAFAEFATQQVFDRRHTALVTEHLGATVTEHLCYDTTAIPVRERVAKVSPPTVPADPPVPRKRGPRPKGAEPPPPPEPTRLQRQQTQTVAEMLAELPTACAVGCKQNSQGNKEYWIGYKFHVVQTDDGVPVAAFITGANVHDSQGAIPLLQLAHARGVRACYDLMDSAYDAQEIHRVSTGLGHVPIIDANRRRTESKAERERLARLPCSRVTLDRALVDVDRRRRFAVRTAVERFNSDLKDNAGARQLRVRGDTKVQAALMCGLLVIFAEAILAFGSG